MTVLGVDDWRLWRELRLEALREAPYAFGSTLAEWQGDGDTEARWRARLENVPFNIIALLDGTPAGMVSGVGPDENADAELISLWVAPFARGRGVGDALIDVVIEWAKTRGASRLVLAVREENKHAIALYGRKGFTDGGEIVDDPESRCERLMVCVLR